METLYYFWQMKEENESLQTSINQIREQQIPLWLELTALLILLGLAIILRLWQLGDIPPGFHFDEAIDLKISLDVAGGARPIYVLEGWGREALYYYLVALVLQFVPYNPIALRVSAVICGIGVLITAYLLVRIWHSRLAAWLTVAFLTFTFWPLAASRFGVRHISLAFMLGLVAWVFWQIGQHPKQRWWHYAVLGLLTGLTMYTYQPARFVPLIFVTFALYIFLFHRDSSWSNWRHWLIWLAVFLAVTLPLIIALNEGGSALEDEQRAFAIEPITQFLDGNAGPVLSNVLATLKIFTIKGDPLKSYNVPDRPIFVPSWTGIFFYSGLVLALWRWRQPVFAFALIWLFFTLLPTVVTISAPNFNRIIAAQVPIMFLAAFPMAEFIFGMRARQKRWGTTIAVIVVSFSMFMLVISTWQDYFEVWPNVNADVHTLNREVSAVAAYLEHQPDNRPVVISSRDIADEDPYIVDVSTDRDDLTIRWVDTGQALALPAGVDETRLIITSERWLDQDLVALSGMSLEPIYQEPEFTVYVVGNGEWTVGDKTPLSYLSPDVTLFTEANLKHIDWPYPYAFCDCLPGDLNSGDLLLTGLTIREKWQLGENLELMTTWQPLKEGNLVSLALFVHLINDTGEIVSQFDGLGYPPHTWRSGDQFVQVARLPLSKDLAPGEYWLQFGLYERETGRRWLLQDLNDVPVADRALIGPLRLDKEGTLRLEANNLRD